MVLERVGFAREQGYMKLEQVEPFLIVYMDSFTYKLHNCAS